VSAVVVEPAQAAKSVATVAVLRVTPHVAATASGAGLELTAGMHLHPYLSCLDLLTNSSGSGCCNNGQNCVNGICLDPGVSQWYVSPQSTRIPSGPAISHVTMADRELTQHV
jgi:hypothetical protein